MLLLPVTTYDDNESQNKSVNSLRLLDLKKGETSYLYPEKFSYLICFNI